MVAGDQCGVSYSASLTDASQPFSCLNQIGLVTETRSEIGSNGKIYSCYEAGFEQSRMGEQTHSDLSAPLQFEDDCICRGGLSVMQC